MMISTITALILAAISFGLVRGGLGVVAAVAVGVFSYLSVYFAMPTLAYGFAGLPTTPLLQMHPFFKIPAGSSLSPRRSARPAPVGTFRPAS